MRYTKEFKLECIGKYKNGIRINDPGGCKHDTFQNKVRMWTRIYDALGEAGMEHKKPAWTWQDKTAMIQRVFDGESIQSVAFSNGIQAASLLKWIGIYRESGIDGLKLGDKRGRPPKMANKIKPADEENKKRKLERELEYLRAENEYLKKLKALVQKRKGRQSKKK